MKTTRKSTEPSAAEIRNVRKLNDAYRESVAQLRRTAVDATCPKDGTDYKEALPGLRVRCERAFEDLQKAADRLPENYRRGYAWALYEPRYGLTRAINEALAPLENQP